MSPASTRLALFTLFALSGFSGLIYESIWAHYLKLLLGHAAYARTLVLVIFMGGLALGSWIAARRTLRLRNLLLGYAVAEGLIGLAGLVFHPVFDAGLGLAYGTVLPALGSPAAAAALKWTAAAAVITPQSILLGMTFPLMSGALVRRNPARSGTALATLYFTNSLGATVGVLVSGFVLIPLVGLPGTILTAGLINMALALVVWAMSRSPAWSTEPGAGAPATLVARADLGVVRLLITASLVTGCASFMYEVGWLRLLALVLGSSTHAFELMLSAFILGLALGSLWIRRRIDSIAEPLPFLGMVQVAMGVLAASTLLFAEDLFHLMGYLQRGIAVSDPGYTLYNLSSHALAMLVMLPATFCAGMTLPLITQALLLRGVGERAIGQVYAANTVGAIIGVIVAVHLALPVLGLKGLMVAGAALDIGLGIVLLGRGTAGRWRYGPVAAGIAALALVYGAARMDERVLASGVFRHSDSRSLASVDVPFHRDGKTATVTVARYRESVIGLKTNGKTDATIRMDGVEPTHDEYTMVLLGAMPVATRPDARRVAVIGFGAGLTSHVLLASPKLEQLDTIEIEPLMVEAAQIYRPRVERAFTDPRATVHFEDARSWLAASRVRYDIIISEPSHPWVSGVASLYTREFYRFASAHLAENGIFAQWIHTSGLSPELLATVLAAIADGFDDYVIYDLNGGDLLMVAGPVGRLALDTDAVLDNPLMRRELETIAAAGEQELRARLLGTRATLEPYMRGYQAHANSDYFPLLDVQAVHARFRRRDLSELLAVSTAAYPVVEMLSAAAPTWTRTELSPEEQVPRLNAGRAAMAVRDYLGAPAQERDSSALPETVRAAAVRALPAWSECGTVQPEAWLASLREIADATVTFLRPGELEAIWAMLDAPRCAAGWSQEQRGWLAVVRAISARDANAMAATATAMFASVRTLDDLEYMLGIAMLGHVAAGRIEAARALWSPYAEPIMNGRPVRAETLMIEAMTRPTHGDTNTAH